MISITLIHVALAEDSGHFIQFDSAPVKEVRLPTTAILRHLTYLNSAVDSLIAKNQKHNISGNTSTISYVTINIAI